jgi:hypothetical protein
MENLFDKHHLERLLPDYLSKAEKGRLLKALEQFQEQGSWNNASYAHFYLNKKTDYFLQGDLLRGIRQAIWNPITDEFQKIYANSLILSNTCDLDSTNERVIPKDVVLAPLTPFGDFVEELSLLVTNKTKLATIIQGVKSQTYSNVFYLPSHPQSNQDFVCFFDNAFWFPTEELTAYLPNIEQIRVQSLDYFGYYLFLVKLSYHFCRLPEEKQR